MKASVHFATILKISANIIIELIKRHDIKSIFDAFKKLWLDACEKARLSINILIIISASKDILIEFYQWNYFVCK